jgi:predicted membrane chloride channel (bestrophin family)
VAIGFGALGFGSPLTAAASFAVAGGALAQSFTRVGAKQAKLAKGLLRRTITINHALRTAERKTVETLMKDPNKVAQLLRAIIQSQAREGQIEEATDKMISNSINPVTSPLTPR